jgi:hypothetical protein
VLVPVNWNFAGVYAFFLKESKLFFELTAWSPLLGLFLNLIISSLIAEKLLK